MKIYTYYQKTEIGWNESDQHSLISLWKQSWIKHGFNPIVLGEVDAKKHNMYEEYKSFFEEIHKEITGSPLNSYGSACWLRWLAYATQPEERFFVSDYDVINHDFKPTEIDGTILFLNGHCPCLANGTPSQFERLCNHYIEFTKANLQKIKEEYNRLDNLGKRRYVCFRDQDFFIIEYFLGFTPFYSNVCDRQTFWGFPGEPNFWKKQVVHYSAHSCEHYFTELYKNVGLQFTNAMKHSIILKHLGEN